MITIYKIENDFNEKKYIGMTSKELDQILPNIKDNLNKEGFKTKIQKAIMETSIEHFKIKKLKSFESNDINDPIIIGEKFKYIEKYDTINNGYNGIYKKYNNTKKNYVKYNTYKI